MRDAAALAAGAAAVLKGEESALGETDPARLSTAGRLSIIEGRRRGLQQAEAELHAALRVSALANQAVREVEKTLGKAWEAAAAKSADGVRHLQRSGCCSVGWRNWRAAEPSAERKRRGWIPTAAFLFPSSARFYP